MTTVIVMVVGGLTGIVTASFGYGWIKNGKFFFPGAALNFVLTFLEVCIIRNTLGK